MSAPPASRVGTANAVELMQTRWDTALLEDLNVAMADASICGLSLLSASRSAGTSKT